MNSPYHHQYYIPPPVLHTTTNTIYHHHYYYHHNLYYHCNLKINKYHCHHNLYCHCHYNLSYHHHHPHLAVERRVSSAAHHQVMANTCTQPIGGTSVFTISHLVVDHIKSEDTESVDLLLEAGRAKPEESRIRVITILFDLGGE